MSKAVCQSVDNLASDAVINATSVGTILSSVHGRQRRQQRNIAKRDLQAAVKYGKRSLGFPCPRTGARTYRFEFADIVYVTDQTCTKEITSWPKQGCSLDIGKETITEEMKAHHEAALVKIADLSSWTSHTVVVVDQSGSMRKTDVDDAMRADVVWVALALDIVAARLRSGEATSSDVLSLVSMRGESTVVLDKRPFDWLLFNDLVDLLRSSMPMGAGNYMPAIDKAEQLLLCNSSGSCALLLLFLSDGRPSDEVPPGTASVKEYWRSFVKERTGLLASRFGRRLTVGSIAFGAPDEDYSALQAIAEEPLKFGSRGYFHATSLNADALSTALSALSFTTTATKQELRQEPGYALQCEVQDVYRESKFSAMEDEQCPDDQWQIYEFFQTCCEEWSGGGWVPRKLQTSVGVAMKTKKFGEGAERMVSKFREMKRGRFVGPPLVAKESRFVKDLDNRDTKAFHEVFCMTQQHAQRFAEKFNARLDKLPGVGPSFPRVNFLECSVYTIDDIQKGGEFGVLVERMLDVRKYKKWNDNDGNVNGQPRPSLGLGELNVMKEQKEERNSEETEFGFFDLVDDASDILQAFSHFTHLASDRRMLVCDLQGVLSSEAGFELTDPVIHRKREGGLAGKYGRTDLGADGIEKFFETHTCSVLCKRLGLRHCLRSDEGHTSLGAARFLL